MRTAPVETRIFWLSLNYLLWHIGIIFLNAKIRDGLVVADVLDILTPFVMIFLTIWLWQAIGETADSSGLKNAEWGALVLFIIGVITFIEGHGMHLSANAISRHLEGMAQTSLYRLTYFFDETLGHILWDGGWVMICVALIWRSKGFGKQKVHSPALIVISALFFGFTYFCNAIEGQTVMFTLPVALVMATTLLVLHRRKTKWPNQVSTFCLFACLFACLLFAVWFFMQGGFPEFSEVG